MTDDVIFRWNADKAELLKADATRNGISFPDVVLAIRGGGLIDVVAHPARPQQFIAVVNLNDYAYAVPFVIEDDGQTWFLKTLFPSRKFTALYLKKRPQ